MIAYRVLFAALLGLAALVLAGCDGQKGTPAGKGAGKDAGKVYDIKGKVVAVDAAKKTVTLDHEDIPGLMKAMKMDFQVEDEKVLSGLKAGDAVHGKLRADGGNYVVTSLEKH
jgi:protein SCO1